MLPTPWEFAGRVTDRQAFWDYALPSEELIFDLREVTYLSPGVQESLIPLALRRPVRLWADPEGQPAQALQRWFQFGTLTDGGQQENGAWELVLDLRSPDARAASPPARGRTPVRLRPCDPSAPAPRRGSVCTTCPLREKLADV